MSHRQRDHHRIAVERQVALDTTDELGQPNYDWQEQFRLDVHAESPVDAGNLGRTATGEIVDAARTIWSPKAQAADIRVDDRVRLWPIHAGESAADLYLVTNRREYYTRRARPELYVYDCQHYSGE